MTKQKTQREDYGTDDIGYDVISSYEHGGVTDEDGIKIMDCIEMIFTKKKLTKRFILKRIDDFVDSMDSSQFKKLNNFLIRCKNWNMRLNINVTCGGKQNQLQGLTLFSGRPESQLS